MPLPQKRLIPALLLALVIAAFATPPLWWSTGDPPVIAPGAPENNQGPANIGQAKHMAKSALDALEAALPGLASHIEADLVGNGKPIPSWDAPATQTERDKNHAPLLIGQLKAIADPFYNHFHAIVPNWLEAERTANGTNHPNSIFPWSAETTDDNNKGIANIGQLKAVFSLRFETIATFDYDGDGMPDLWESDQGLDPNDPDDANADADGDGLTNAQELAAKRDPNSADVWGPVNTDFREFIENVAHMSFRNEYTPDEYPSDLYYGDDIVGWQPNEGDYIEIWQEDDDATPEPDDGDRYIELQSHLQAHGVKQEFPMLSESRMTFILRYKGRYEHDKPDPYHNAFELKVKGAAKLIVDGNEVAEDNGVRTRLFTDTEEWQEWQIAVVTIIAPEDEAGFSNVTLSLVPDETEYGGEHITHGGFVSLLPVELYPNPMPTSGVARAKFVLLAADKDTMPFFAEEDLPTITIGNEICRDVHQDEIDPRVFYFTPPESPNGGAGNFDFELSGITVPNHPLLSNGDPLKLEGLVEYTADASDGTKGFMDSNLVSWDEAKSFIDHASEQGAISGDGANQIMGEYADRQATDQSGLAKVFFDGLSLDQTILEDYEKKLDARIIEFEGDYPVTPPNTSEYVFPTGMSVQALSDTAYEGGVAVIRFWRPTFSDQPVVLSYEVGGSATEGSDYIKPSGAITIPANAQYADLEISIISDALSDDEETITIVLKSGLGYNVAFFDKVEIECRDAVQTAAASFKVSEVGDGAQQQSTAGPPQPEGPQFGPGFFTAAKALLSKSNRNKLLGTAVYTNPDGNRGMMNYAVFDANKLKLEVVTNSTSGQTIANILTTYPQAEIALNGALFNYKDLEPLITTGIVLRGGARLPTSTDSTKDSWKPAKARYWFGQTQDKDAAKNAGQALSYQFGKGNPPETGQIDRAMGGLISLIYPNGHAQNAQDDSDLGNYEAGWFTKPSGNIGKRVRGAAARLVPYNIIGIDRETGLLIVVSKKFKEPILLKDAQQGLIVSGCDLALVTDGGGSVACWAKDWPHDGGYLSRERRQKGSPDKEETVTSYILFMSN